MIIFSLFGIISFNKLYEGIIIGILPFGIPAIISIADFIVTILTLKKNFQANREMIRATNNRLVEELNLFRQYPMSAVTLMSERPSISARF